MDQILIALFLVGAMVVLGVPVVLLTQENLDNSVMSFRDFSRQADIRSAQQISVTYIEPGIDCLDKGSDPFITIYFTNTGLEDIEILYILVNGFSITQDAEVVINYNDGKPGVQYKVVDPATDEIVDSSTPPEKIIILEDRRVEMDIIFPTGVSNEDWHNAGCVPEIINLQMVSTVGKIFEVDVAG